MLSDLVQSSDALSKMLPDRKPKGVLPVLVKFISESCGKERYVFTDIPLDILTEMWKEFNKIEPDGTSEEFMTILEGILHNGSPRIYRNINYLPLNRNHLLDIY